MFMREITDMEDIHKIMFSLMVEFKQFCEQNQLRYFLTYGTLLGAVRHQGFIPWDDDADILMPYPDYLKFLSLGKSGIGTHSALHQRGSGAFLFDKRTKRIDSLLVDYKGVSIDIVPLTGMPSNKINGYLYLLRLILLGRILWLHNAKPFTGKSLFRALVKTPFIWIFRLFDSRKLMQKLDRLFSKNAYDEAEFVVTALVSYGIKRERLKRQCFSKAIPMQFEGETFCVPSGYAQILTSIYGDYMQHPPKEQQIPKHQYKAYWLDTEEPILL